MAKKHPKRPPTSGSFKKGQSGNPKGRPKEASDIRQYAKTFAIEMFERLIELSRNAEEKTSLQATIAALDRAIGKPMQEHQIGGNGGVPIEHRVIVDTGIVEEEGTTEYEEKEGNAHE